MSIGYSVGQRHILHGENLRRAGAELFLHLDQGHFQRWTFILVIMVLKFLNGTVWNYITPYSSGCNKAGWICDTDLKWFHVLNTFINVTVSISEMHTYKVFIYYNIYDSCKARTKFHHPTKRQKRVRPACQCHCWAVKACCELPAQIFQETEGHGCRETACTYAHVGHTLGWEEAETHREAT